MITRKESIEILDKIDFTDKASSKDVIHVLINKIYDSFELELIKLNKWRELAGDYMNYEYWIDKRVEIDNDEFSKEIQKDIDNN